MRSLLFLVCASLCLVGAQSQEAGTASLPRLKVLGNNVNLRAKPLLTSETVGQVSRGDELEQKGREGEWVEIVAPESVSFWVLGDYIKGGRIEGDDVNVRAGAGINFSIVGQLERDASVNVRGAIGPWVSIDPPRECSAWINASFVELEQPEPEPSEPEQAAAEPQEEPPVQEEPELEPTPPVEPEQVEPPAPTVVFERKPALADDGAPAGLELITNQPQGERLQFEGILRPRSYLVRSPSKFRLVAYDRDGRLKTLCFVRGNEAQLDALLNRGMIIGGRVYWVRRSEVPVMVPERIVLKAVQ